MEEKIIKEVAKLLELRYNTLADAIAKVVRKYGIKEADPFWVRNKRLYEAVNKLFAKMNADVKQMITHATVKAWQASNEQIDEIVRTYINGSAVTSIVDPEWLKVNLQQMNAFINRSVDGLGTSGRVWQQSLKARKMVETTIKEGLLTGQSAASQSRILRQALKNPNALFRRVRDKKTGELKLSAPAKKYNPGRGVYRSAYQNALRLTGTEIKMAFQVAESERIQQIPFIKGIKVNLSSSHPRPDICDHMKGTYPPDFVFLGWHPRCICYTTTLMLSDSEFKKYLDTGKVDAKQYTNSMPKEAINYVNDNKDSILGAKNIPYWYRQNSDFINKKTNIKT